jgi:hypothetical protein
MLTTVYLEERSFQQLKYERKLKAINLTRTYFKTKIAMAVKESRYSG